ncbi:unnamed protein product, partial [Mesorhabditis spiculigera]
AQTPQKSATKSKSPTKKRIQDLEEHKMERQNTHTIIHNDPVRTANLPGPSPPKDNGEKPKSVFNKDWDTTTEAIGEGDNRFDTSTTGSCADQDDCFRRGQEAS